MCILCLLKSQSSLKILYTLFKKSAICDALQSVEESCNEEEYLKGLLGEIQ